MPVLSPATRAVVRELVRERTLTDALATYYALHHPPTRTELFVHTLATGQPRGFLVRARTGLDLFRPLVTFRVADEASLVELINTGLLVGRPMYLTVPESLAIWANKHLAVNDAELYRVYQFNPNREAPRLNILAVNSLSPDGTPRCEIRNGEQAGAVAGVNWQSPHFAEVYVYTDPAVRGRGWARATVSSVARAISASGRIPLYVVAESNDSSIRVAEAVGFEDTGLREFVGNAVRRG